MARASVGGETVVQPRSQAEVAQVLERARSQGRVVSIRGGGTKTGFGRAVPDDPLILETLGLDRMLEHRPEDLVVRAEAGMRLGALEAILLGRGQTLGWDVPGGDEATVGGAIAAGVEGALAGRHRLRDDVLEVRARLATGVEVRHGAPVVKNVAGYELPRLWVGSMGALGVIEAVTLRVRPRPERSVTHRRLLPDAAARGEWLARLGRVDPEAAALVWPAGGDLAGLVVLSGRSHQVDAWLGALGPGEILEGDAGQRAVASALAPAPCRLFLAMEPSRCFEALEAARARVGPVAASADLLTGWIRVEADPRAVDPQALGADADHPYRWEGAARLLGRRPVTGPPGPADALVLRVLDAFDPERRFDRDRLIPPADPGVGSPGTGPS